MGISLFTVFLVYFFHILFLLRSTCLFNLFEILYLFVQLKVRYNSQMLYACVTANKTRPFASNFATKLKFTLKFIWKWCCVYERNMCDTWIRMEYVWRRAHCEPIHTASGRHFDCALHVHRIRPTVDRSLNASKTDDFVAVIRVYENNQTTYDSSYVSLIRWLFISFARFCFICQDCFCGCCFCYYYYYFKKPLFDSNELDHLQIRCNKCCTATK